MICPYCHNEIEENTEVCPHCQKKMGEVVLEPVRLSDKMRETQLREQVTGQSSRACLDSPEIDGGTKTITSRLAPLLMVLSFLLALALATVVLYEDRSAGTELAEQIRTTMNGALGVETEEEESAITAGIHTYRFVQEDVTYNLAAARARSMGGYLVRIDSQEEYNTVLEQLRDEQAWGSDVLGYYIGGRRCAAQGCYYLTDQNGKVSTDHFVGNGQDWFWGPNESSCGIPDSNRTALSIAYNDDLEDWYGEDTIEDILTDHPEFSGQIGYIVEIETEKS